MPVSPRPAWQRLVPVVVRPAYGPVAGWLRRLPPEAAVWSAWLAVPAWVLRGQRPASAYRHREAEPFDLPAVLPPAARQVSASPPEAAEAACGRGLALAERLPEAAWLPVPFAARATERAWSGVQAQPPGAVVAEPLAQPRVAAEARWVLPEEAALLRAAALADAPEEVLRQAAAPAGVELLPVAARLRAAVLDVRARQRAERPWPAAASTCLAPALSVLAPARSARSVRATARL